ncbi:MAG TPA: hypothetical protein G4O00_06120 [Thermoflexia bacterium]|jgi:hypothetical protein|nr:hypothetical protein [Thermoflexia bacterium]
MGEVLVSPLGRSPGAVSGVFFALRQRGIQITEVVTIGTSDGGVLKAAEDYLKPIFQHEKVVYDPIHIPARELKDGRRNVRPFVAMAELALKQARENGHAVHVAVTGGRSGMGALMALATNFYGTDHLWHLWVKREIEERGSVEAEEVRRLTRARDMVESPYLNPTVEGEDAYQLVELPFVDLRPLHPLLWAYRRTGAVPDVDSPLYQILARSGIQRFTDIFPAGLTFGQADELLDLIHRFQKASPEEERVLLPRIGALLQEVGIVEKADWSKVHDLIQGKHPVEGLLRLCEGMRKDRMGFWGWLKENKDAIQATVSIAMFLLEALELFMKMQGYL